MRQFIAPEATHDALRAIWQATQDVILTLDGDGIITSANPALRRLFGYSEEEIIGKPLSLILPSQTDHIFRFAHDAHLLGLTKTHRKVPVQLVVEALPVKPHRLAVIRDVTEQLLAQQVQAMAIQLGEFSQALQNSSNDVQWQTFNSVNATQLSLTKRIVVAEDHPICRCGLTAMINNEVDLEVCGEADTAASAQRLVQSLKPDALLLSMNLSKGNGLQLLNSIRAQGIKLPMLVVSMYDETFFAERAIRAGAAGYVSKAEPLKTILFAIREVLQGRLYVGPNVSEQLLRANLHTGNHKAERSEDKLTDRELEVFMMIGRGYATKRIADELHLSTKTIDSHKEHIREKLGLEDNLALVRHAMAWLNDSEL